MKTRIITALLIILCVVPPLVYGGWLIDLLIAFIIVAGGIELLNLKEQDAKDVYKRQVMHRNSYLCAPKVLRPTYQHVQRDDLFFAGQLCGVEGYVESAASGLLAGMNMANLMREKAVVELPNTCVIGSMAHYITHASERYFQPMNANFGICLLYTSRCV